MEDLHEELYEEDIIEEKRQFKVYFIKEYKWFFNKNYKKAKSDYILNVNKIIKEKFNNEFFSMNKFQAFLLNYEITKLLDKAINISNRKYDKIVYINNNITISSVLNTMIALKQSYPKIDFDFILIDKDDEMGAIKEKKEAKGLQIIMD